MTHISKPHKPAHKLVSLLSEIQSEEEVRWQAREHIAPNTPLSFYELRVARKSVLRPRTLRGGNHSDHQLRNQEYFALFVDAMKR